MADGEEKKVEEVVEGDKPAAADHEEKKRLCPECGSDDLEGHTLETYSRASSEGGIVLVAGEVPVHCRVCLSCGWLGGLHVTERGVATLQHKKAQRIAKHEKQEQKEHEKQEHQKEHHGGLLSHIPGFHHKDS